VPPSLGTPPAAEPDTVDHPAEREVARWTRCTTVVDPPTTLAGAGR